MNVYIKKCNEYDFNLVKEKVNELFTELNLLEKINENTNVFVKLNLVGPFEPNLGITTHPVVLKAVLDILSFVSKDMSNLIREETIRRHSKC